jgi:hypothetical protein
MYAAICKPEQVEASAKVEREVKRHTAAVLSVNDTLRDPIERERLRRAVLDSAELLTRRVTDIVSGAL